MRLNFVPWRLIVVGRQYKTSSHSYGVSNLEAAPRVLENVAALALVQYENSTLR